jgi:hypothetical protein
MPEDTCVWRRIFEQVAQFREQIEAQRRPGGVRFWFDRQEASYGVSNALLSTYLWNQSLLSEKFPDGACAIDIPPRTLVAVTSNRAATDQVARQALLGCESSAAMRVQALGTEQMYSSRMTLLRVEDEPSRTRPVRATLDGPSGGRMHALEAAAPPEPFPLAGWSPMQAEQDRAWFTPVPAGLAMRTLDSRYGYSFQYSPLETQEEGTYRFNLQYEPEKGSFSFGAVDHTYEGGWLGVTRNGEDMGDHYEMWFRVKLARGRRIRLLIANSNELNTPAKIVLRRVTAIRLAPQAP